MTYQNGGSCQSYSQLMGNKESACTSSVLTAAEQVEEKMDTIVYMESLAPVLDARLGHKRTDFTSEDWT